MTNQEAIAIVKNEKACVERAINGCDRQCEKCDLLKDDKEIQQGYDLAIQALEKQVPKKITEIHCDEYYCPNCGAENLCDQYQVTDKFCPNCGQAFDWSDEE